MSRGDTESSYVSCDVLRTMLSQTTCIESIWHLDESKRIALKRSFTCPRYECVSLVQNIASHFRLGADTRDLANDFATKYLWKSEDAACECLELVAATSVVVAAKLLEHSPEVGIKSFKQFDKTRMRLFECAFILAIGPDAMRPLNTPSTFARLLVRLARCLSGLAVSDEAVSDVIGAFLQDNASLSFAPCTIAMAAVLFLVDLDPADRATLFLAYADLLPPKSGFSSALDADKCLCLLQQVRGPSSPGVSSPPSVAMKRPLSPDNSAYYDSSQSAHTTPQRPLKLRK